MLLHYAKTFFLIIFLERRGDEKKGEVIGDEAKKETEKDEDRKLVFSVYYQYQRQ